ncbi:MAG: glycosyltransferase [Rickettsiales bacterium]|nr:glycosyltransferase [Rickettsiales bacterium]
MKISLIITSFNAAKYLSKAIESFLAQNYDDKELLIIDDISTDKTHEIIAHYQKKFPHLIKWIKEKDSGISNARNIALKYVSGDLVGFLGADDFLHQDFFSQLKYYLAVNSDFDVVYFNSYSIGASNGFSPSSNIAITVRNLIKYCPIGSGESFYYRREIFDIFKFNEKNRYSMDYELNMAIAASKKIDGKKYSFYPVNISAVFNYNSGENISSSNSIKQRLETICVQLKYAKNLLEKLKIFWRGKKLIAKNFSEFSQIYKIIIDENL